MSPNPKVTTLPNGLRIATDTVPGAETASLGVWTRCGARHETAENNGVAHMLEHMLFKGTKRRSAQAIAEEMEEVGAHANAYTGRENTAYYARFLKDDAERALDIIADILQYSTFDEEELRRERLVVIQEIGQTADTPDDIIFDHFQGVAYPDHPLGRPILGTEETVGTMSRQTLQTYIGRHYAPQNLILAAGGAIDHNWLAERAADLFTDLPALQPTPVQAASYQGGECRVEEDLEQVHLVLGFKGVSFHDPDHYAAQVLSAVLGGGMSSRLFQEIREKRGLVYTIHSFCADFVDGGLFAVYAGTGDDRLTELVPVLCEELAKAHLGFSLAEIGRAKAQLKASTLMGLESSFARAEHLAMNLLVHDRPIPIAESLAKLDAVTPDDLARVAQRITASKPTLAAMGSLARLESYDRIAGRIAA